MAIGHHVHGHGPIRAVVLHDWMGLRTFDPVLGALDPDLFTLAFLHYRGYGLSRAIAGPFDIQTIAADAASLATHLGWDRFATIGHSMGGKAALRLALDLGERVTGIVAITPVWAGRVPFDAETLALFRGAATDVKLRASIIHHSTGGRLSQYWSRSMAEFSAAFSEPDAFAAYFESWSGDDFADQLHALTHAPLVIVGEHDAGITVEDTQATWIDQLPGARLEVIAGSGHYPMLESPLVVARLLERFLLQQSATTGP